MTNLEIIDQSEQAVSSFGSSIMKNDLFPLESLQDMPDVVADKINDRGQGIIIGRHIKI